MVCVELASALMILLRIAPVMLLISMDGMVGLGLLKVAYAFFTFEEIACLILVRRKELYTRNCAIIMHGLLLNRIKY